MTDTTHTRAEPMQGAAAAAALRAVASVTALTRSSTTAAAAASQRFAGPGVIADPAPPVGTVTDPLRGIVPAGPPGVTMTATVAPPPGAGLCCSSSWAPGVSASACADFDAAGTPAAGGRPEAAMSTRGLSSSGGDSGALCIALMKSLRDCGNRRQQQRRRRRHPQVSCTRCSCARQTPPRRAAHRLQREFVVFAVQELVHEALKRLQATRHRVFTTRTRRRVIAAAAAHIERLIRGRLDKNERRKEGAHHLMCIARNGPGVSLTIAYAPPPARRCS